MKGAIALQQMLRLCFFGSGIEFFDGVKNQVAAILNERMLPAFGSDRFSEIAKMRPEPFFLSQQFAGVAFVASPGL